MSTRFRLVTTGLVIIFLLSGCGGRPLPAASTHPITGKPQWWCPTPVMAGDPTTIAAMPTVTPYYHRDQFMLGQDVLSNGLRVTVHGITSGDTAPAAIGGGQLQWVDLELTSAVSLPLDLAAQLVIREVEQDAGQAARGWWTTDTATLATTAITLPTRLEAGIPWRGQIPIRTPSGTPVFVVVYRTPADALLREQPTDGVIVVQNRRDPTCAGNIARVPFPTMPAGGGPGAPINGTPVAVPPGTNPLVAYAVSKLAWPYVWGGESEAEGGFDCSGLLYAAYGSVGLTIPRTSQAMWQSPQLQRIGISELRPGDLVFFHTDSSRFNSPPTHVGMYIGDMNGNGTPDLVHALSPAWGIRIEDNWLTKPWLVAPWPDGTPRLWGAGYFVNPYR